MVICTVQIRPKGAGIGKFQKAFGVITPLVRKEPGCIEYHLYKDLESEGRFFLFEKWESRSHLETHLKTPHMQDYFKAVKDVFEIPDKVDIFEIKPS